MRESPPPSLWAATSETDSTPATSRLDLETRADVAIVGAGYTGLWTALSLVMAEPSLRVVVVERHRVGFGASGRNGGWCSALLPLGLAALAERHGRHQAIAWKRAMFDAVDEVGRFSAASARDGIDPQYHRGGTITLARQAHQRRRLELELAEARHFGFGEDDLRMLDARAAAERCRADGTVAALFTPHCAALHPLCLTQAIAGAAARRGVQIAEHVGVTDLAPKAVHTTVGTISADIIVLATEAYSARLPGRGRDVLPVYSLMIGSEPLTDSQWDDIGLADRPTFTTASNMVIYGQRTADGRLAFGGRGAPYHFGSRIDVRFDTDDRVRSMLRDSLTKLFPVVDELDFPYHWGGPLGAPRDWHPHVAFDPASGMASAGGYVGDGVAAANLAGRTLADLILGRETAITLLPWVGHRSRRWEREPLRWLGVRLGALAASRADVAESSTAPFGRQRAAGWARLLDALTGR